MNRWRLMSLAVLLMAVIAVGGCFLFPNNRPVASFTVTRSVNPDNPDPLVVVLDASASSDPDGDEILDYMWSFGDDVTILTPLEITKTLSVPVLTVRYPVEGTYHLTLVVVDSNDAPSDPVSTDMQVPLPE